MAIKAGKYRLAADRLHLGFFSVLDRDWTSERSS